MGKKTNYTNKKSKETELKKPFKRLDTLVYNYSEQVKKGNVPLSEVVRLQSLALEFRSQLADIQSNLFRLQENIKLLTNTSEGIIAVGDENTVDRKLKQTLIFTEKQLQEKALTQNLENLTAIKLLESNELFLKWQKSLSTPDLVFGATYDQRGGAFNNQVNFTFGTPLPLWNRNKGNIK